jgi:hypothetical protein
MTFEKPCGSDAAPSVEENTAAVPKVGKVGVLGSDMLSQSMSTSASSSSHTLQDRNKYVSRANMEHFSCAYLCGAEVSVIPAICRSRTKNVGNGHAG